jgi:hypothetical protein
MVDSLKAVFHIYKHDRHGNSSVVDKRPSGYVTGLLEAARQHGGGVLIPKQDPRTGEWAVIDSEGNLFLAVEEQ